MVRIGARETDEAKMHIYIFNGFMVKKRANLVVGSP